MWGGRGVVEVAVDEGEEGGVGGVELGGGELEVEGEGCGPEGVGRVWDGDLGGRVWGEGY